MSDTVKLAAALGADPELNGLDSLASSMLDDPQQVHVCLVWIDCGKIVENTDEATRVPYARVRRIEPLGSVEEAPSEIARLAMAAAEKRTGKAPLPFGAVEQHDIEDDDQ